MLKAFKIVLLLLAVCSFRVNAQNINRQMVRRLMDELPATGIDTNRIRILVELGKFQVFKPGEQAIDLDSGRHYLDEASAVNATVKSVKWAHQIESMYIIAGMESGDSLVAKKRFSQLMLDCNSTGDHATEALTEVRMGVWLNNRMHKYPEAISLYEHAGALYRALQDQEGEINVLKEIAYVHMNDGKMNLADSELQHVLVRYKAIGYKKLHYTYDLLATIYRLRGDFKTGLEYSIKCVETMERTGDTLQAANFYGDLARMYYEVGNPVKSLYWYRKSLTKWRQEKLGHFAMFTAAGYIVRDMISHQQAAEGIKLMEGLAAEIPPTTRIQKACIAQHLAYCYDALHDYPKAEKYYLDAIDLYERKGTALSEVGLLAEREMGGFYLQRHNWDKARYHLQRALSIAPEQNALVTIRDLHGMLFSVDSAQGNYPAAIQHLHMQKLLNDSIFGETKSRQIEELQVQYETSNKEQEIQLLINQSQLQQSQLEKEKLTKKVTIGTIVFLLLLFGMSLNRYRLKQKHNQLLKKQQLVIHEKNRSLENIIGEKDGLLKEKEKLLEEKEWLIREIHHRVKNNMQVVISLLSNQCSYLSNMEAVVAIRESQRRLHAMSLIHQQLYQKDTLSVICMKDYIHQLVYQLDEAGPGKRQIHFETDIDPVMMEVSNAVPVGLILNEAITNAIKYAFPGDRSGRIAISMKQGPGGQCVLAVKDDGIGLPADFNMRNHSSMGLNLIKMMSEQLNGSFSISSRNGTVLIVGFSNIETASITLLAETIG